MSGDLKMAGIYKITQKNTGRIYIGATMSNMGQRWAYHISLWLNTRHENKPLQQDFDKYGLSSFTFEVIELLPFATKEELRERESHWIKTIREKGECYNVRTSYRDKSVLSDISICVFCDKPVYLNYMCQEHIYLARQGLPKFKRRLITKDIATT